MDAIYHFNRFFEPPLVFDDIDLVQIGRMFCAPDTVIGKHLHLNWFELTVVSDGKGILITNDTEIEIKRGDIYLSFPADEHAIRSDPSAPLAFGFLAIYPHAPIKCNSSKKLCFRSEIHGHACFATNVCPSYSTTHSPNSTPKKPYARKMRFVICWHLFRNI